MTVAAHHDPEWLVRKKRIDPRLDGLGWSKLDPAAGDLRPHRVEEYETANGPADYALCLDGRVLGVVEAKKLTVGPQNVLTQAERYSRGARDNPFNFDGFRVPFLYSTNGEVIWFRDARHPMNRSRQVAAFHTPAALAELMERDFDAAIAGLRAMPNTHPRLRPYQVEANTAVEEAIAARKREMLQAMATGTGKTFTTVNQVYRLMKSSLTLQHFAEFEACYGPDPNGRSPRKPADSRDGRWRSFHITEVKERGFKLDSFKWIKDESIEDADELPPPEELATDAIGELEGAVEELNAVLALLQNGNGGKA